MRGKYYLTTHPCVLHPGSEEVRDWRRETDCSLLVAGEDGLDVRLALEKVRPSVGLVYGLSERQTGGWDGSPSAALELVPAPGPAPHHAVQLLAAHCGQVGEAGGVQVKCAERLTVRRHPGSLTTLRWAGPLSLHHLLVPEAGRPEHQPGAGLPHPQLIIIGLSPSYT